MAAVLQRAPILTEDMDVVHDRAPDNVDRLVLALTEMNAVYRDDPRNLHPGVSHLRGPGSQLLESGRLRFDFIGELTPGLMLIHLEATLEEREKLRSGGG
jgi:hypothetical protein